MTYTTVFDITTNHSDYGSVRLLFIVFLFIGLLILATLFLKDKQYKNIFTGDATAIKKLIIGGAFTVISLGVLFVTTSIKMRTRSEALTAIQDDKCNVVEGLVENYKPMPKEGHKNESFDVGGVHFEFSDFSLNNPGYHNAASLGGAIRPNLYVRIKYYPDFYDNRILLNNIIVKLEVQKAD